MYNRRDQADAHAFLAGRLVAAVLRAEPDAPERPLRRTSTGMLGGVAIAILVVAAVVAIGLFTGMGSGNSWRKPGTLIVDKDNGNRYLLLGDVLRPVLNYASARLLVHGNPSTASVRDSDLARIPKGAPIGILGAPDALPTVSGGSAKPWTVCAGSGKDGPTVAVTVGVMPDVRPSAVGEALLVRVGEQLYLVWQGTVSRITEAWVPRALGLDPTTAMAVDAAWLNTLPAGPDLGAPPLDRDGQGPLVGGAPTTTGQLVTVPDAVGDKLFAAAPGGLIPVSGTVGALVGADPRGGLTPLRTTPAELAKQHVLPAPPWQSQLPPQPPTPMDTRSRMPCVRWDGTAASLVSAPPLNGPGQSGGQAGLTRDGRVADRVEVAPGGGFLARTRPAPGIAGAGIYLITEAGAKFPVASEDAAEALGFPARSAQLVPAELLDLLPTGPPLDVIQ
ncbi:type VII secretion protein EccB [Amycolatopsis pigmentata]|uniref:Type VII secretion protein EccB n=1 Tax=Amycolatopsis pigmentata TaxID=450801 RepID=A0ABW5G186_9PSEU